MAIWMAEWPQQRARQVQRPCLHAGKAETVPVAQPLSVWSSGFPFAKVSAQTLSDEKCGHRPKKVWKGLDWLSRTTSTVSLSAQQAPFVLWPLTLTSDFPPRPPGSDSPEEGPGNSL